MSLGGGDTQVLLRRIRHGFIICDDTELCDKIITQEVENEQRRRALAKSKSIDIDKTDLLTLLRTDPDFILDELAHSPEWTAHNVQVRRVRCETLGRLDEIKTENEAKRKVQVISWRDPKTAQTDRRTSDEPNSSGDDEHSSSPLFQRRFEPIHPLVHQSPLTALLLSTDQKQNPFTEYAKFDSSSNIGPNQSKKITIHFQFHEKSLVIITSSNATVEEAIGLICYKYTVENREPHLVHKEPSKYLLCIADDEGQAEDDFPPLIHSKPFVQYDFPHLTLVQKATAPHASMSSSSSGSAQIKPSDDEGSVIDSSRSVTPSPSERRKFIGSSDKASAIATNEDLPDTTDPINQCYLAYQSLDQRSYDFDYYPKSSSNKHVRARVDVSGEQIRVELLDKKSKLNWQHMSLTTQRLINCTIVTKDSNGSKNGPTRVQLTFETQQESDGARVLQMFEFESSLELASQFHDQILNIIKLRQPEARDTYEQQQQEQHLQRSNTSKKKRSILNLIGGISGSSSSTKS